MKNQKSLLLLALATTFVLAQTPIRSNAQEDVPPVPNEAELDEPTGLENAAENMEENAVKNEEHGNAAEALKKNAEVKKAKAEVKKAKKAKKAARKAAKKKAKSRKS